MKPPAGLLPRLTLGCALLVAAFFADPANAQTFNYIGAFTDVGNPTGLSLDTVDGVTYLYVSDHNGGRVFKYHLGTGARTQIGLPGRGAGQFVWPDAIAIEPVTHDLYIPDRQLHRVTRITNTGNFVMSWGGDGPETNRFGHPGAGSAPGQFNGPQGAVIDAAGNLYITEHENHRVQKFRVTQSGDTWKAEVLAVWGGGGGAPGQFNTPYGVTLDAAGNVWVADGFNSRLQKFTPTGELLGQILVRGPSEPHLVCTWVTFDAAGDLYVSVTSDPNTGGVLANQRIEKFNAAGASLARWGTYGSEPGNFKLPFGFAIDRATQRAYVADWDNNRIQIFDLGSGGGATAPQGAASQAVPAGATATLRASAAADASYQWRFNGSALPNATTAALAIAGAAPAHAGLYTTLITQSGTPTLTAPAILGLVSAAKVIGSATEVGPDIRHTNGNTYDQLLLGGTSTSVTADPGQIVRLSYLDLTDDIVQVEFSGAGTLTLTLEASSGPAAPRNYTQPGVTYMKGHANLVVAGADETTHLAVFAVGRITAVNQALFRSDVSYDGWADLGCISILSANGKFGGLHAGNATFSSSQGHTGLFAPGVAFADVVVIGDIHASNDATPVLTIGSAPETKIAGGNLQQFNNRAVQTAGLTRLTFTDGSDAHGLRRAAQANQARLEQNGVNVTAEVVRSP